MQGLTRTLSSFSTGKISQIYNDPHTHYQKLILYNRDFIDCVNITNLINKIQSTETESLGAKSHVQVSCLLPQYTFQEFAIGAVSLLESIHASDVKCHYCQAGTSEIFGSIPHLKNKNTFYPETPYVQ